VGIEGGLIRVLLVEKKLPGFGRRSVCLIHPTTGFESRQSCENREPVDRLIFMAGLDHIGHGKADHEDTSMKTTMLDSV
jgi:hypothetical protein